MIVLFIIFLGYKGNAQDLKNLSDSLHIGFKDLRDLETVNIDISELENLESESEKCEILNHTPDLSQVIEIPNSNAFKTEELEYYILQSKELDNPLSR